MLIASNRCCFLQATQSIWIALLALFERKRVRRHANCAQFVVFRFENRWVTSVTLAVHVMFHVRSLQRQWWRLCVTKTIRAQFGSATNVDSNEQIYTSVSSQICTPYLNVRWWIQVPIARVLLTATNEKLTPQRKRVHVNRLTTKYYLRLNLSFRRVLRMPVNRLPFWSINDRLVRWTHD